MLVLERRSPVPWRAQFAAAAPLVPVWLATLVVLGLVSLGDADFVADVMLDANSRSGAEWYVGLVTWLAVLSWGVAGVSAAWGAAVAAMGGRPAAVRMLRGGALLSGLLLADDLGQFHAVLLPERTGVGKPVWLAILVVAAASWAWRSRVEIARTRVLLVVGAIGAFVASILVDRLGVGGSARLSLLIEDGAKLAGISAWAAYFVFTTRDIARSVVSASRARPDDVQRRAGPEPLDVLGRQGVERRELFRRPVRLVDHAAHG
jgi:hypothetical protein